MAALFNIEKASEEVFDFVCGPCHVDGEVLQAKGFCSDCQDYLCNICMKHHLRPKPWRHHILLDENAMPKDKKATSTKVNVSDICTERCPKHSGNIIEYYCQSHDSLGCTKCFISDNHRKCEGVVCIEDATAGLYESPEYKTYTGKIGQIVDDLSKSSAVQQENDENIKMYSIRAKKEIQHFRKSLNEFLDRLENEMDQQVSQMQESQTSKWISTSKQVEQLDYYIKTIKRTTEQTKKSGQVCNSYINMKRNVHQLKQLEDQMVTVQKEIKVSEYNFKPEVNLQNIMKDTMTFGKLVTSTEDEAGYLGSTPSPTPRHSNAQNTTNTPTQSDNSALIDALTTRRNWYQQKKFWNNQCNQYRDAIKSVKAGGRVDFDSLPAFQAAAIESVKAGRRVDFYSLPTYSELGPIPRELREAYNKFHGY